MGPIDGDRSATRIQVAQLIEGVGVAGVSHLLKESQAFIDIGRDALPLQQELSQAEFAIYVACCIGCLLEQLGGFGAIGRHHGAVAIEFSQAKRGAGVAGIGGPLQ